MSEPPLESPPPVRTEDELRAFLPSLLPALRPRAEELLRLLPRWGQGPPGLRRPLRVAVMGRFKTGKSHLINALLGESVLPSDLGECTAGVIWLTAGTDPAVRERDAGSGPDAAWRPSTWERFRRLADLTTSEEGGQGNAMFAAPPDFGLSMPHSFLSQVELADTPGYDGYREGSGERARQAIERAARWADACLLVLSKGVEDLDVTFAGRIRAECPQVAVVLNKSDQYDAEDLEAIGIDLKETWKAKLGSELDAWFAVSALWQAGDGRARDEVRQGRRFYEEPEPVHQWAELRNWLAGQRAQLSLSAQERQIGRAADACVLAAELDRVYSLRSQAEHLLPRCAQSLAGQMTPPLGPAYLKMALGNVAAGKPAPWDLLAGFGVTPERLAPRLVLSEGLRQEAVEYLTQLMLDAAGAASARGDLGAIARLRERVPVLVERGALASDDSRRLHDGLCWWELMSGCADAGARYGERLKVVRERWRDAEKGVAERDTDTIRTQLEYTLAALVLGSYG